MVNIAVLGYGTVGSGVYEVIRTNPEIINKNSGDEINVTGGHVSAPQELLKTFVFDSETKQCQNLIHII